MKASYLGACLLALFSSALCAEVAIIGTDIPGLHQKDGKGVYDIIVNEALVSKGLANLKVYPPPEPRQNLVAVKIVVSVLPIKIPNFIPMVAM